MCAIAVESTTLLGVTSRCRTTPRIRRDWRSLLIVTSLVPSMTRSPLGRTSTTRADNHACNWPDRDVVPCPAKFIAEEASRSFAKLTDEPLDSRPKSEAADALASPCFWVEVFAEFEAVEDSTI